MNERSTARRVLRPVCTKSLVSLFVIAASVFACGDGGPRSLDTNTFDRTCSVDTDCLLVSPIEDCHSCCGSAVPLRDTPALQTAIDDVNDTCKGLTICAMSCNDVAACTGGRCEKKAGPP